VFNLMIGAMFVALTAIGVNMISIIPFLIVGGVPITLQTFFTVMAGLVIESRLGSISKFVYMVLGLAVVPVFAQFKGGAAMLLTPTFGFILSFIVVAYVAGKLVEMRRTLPMYITAALVALVINYVIGTNWMYAAYLFWFEAPADLSYKLVWLWMAVPLPKDIVLSILAGAVAYRLNKVGMSVRKPIYKQTTEI